jgi:tRNA modification GTPase
MRRARAELALADIAILVTQTGHEARDAALLTDCSAAATRIVVHNKIDLDGQAARSERAATGEVHIHLSALSGAGVAQLRGELLRLGGRDASGAGTFSARRRHVEALERVAAHLAAADAALCDRRAGELAAEELRLAQRALGELTGEYSSDDLLGAIFSTFCIGK